MNDEIGNFWTAERKSVGFKDLCDGGTMVNPHLAAGTSKCIFGEIPFHYFD